MLKKIWRSLGSSEVESTAKKSGTAGVNAPPLNESDYEFLFLQLLEGLAHGWQQPRIVSFFEDLEDRISQQQWLDWLNGFGSRMLSSAAPDNNLASQMVQLGEMQCGAIGDVAYDLGMKVLTRGQQPVYVDFDSDELVSGEPNMFEFAGTDMLSATAGNLEVLGDSEASIFEFAGPDASNESEYTQENIADSSANQASDAQQEVKEVTLEEFYAILQQDPELVQGIGQELGLERPDPELIIQALVAQAQAQEPQS